MSTTLDFHRLPVVERLKGASDLDGVIAVDDTSFDRPWTRAMYEADLANSSVTRIYVIRTAEFHVAGYCSAWLLVPELHINNLAIRPECRRRGLATFLLERVLDAAIAEGATRATLEVRRSNHAARALYQGLGFRVRGVRRDYYTDPVEDGLILWREPAQSAVLDGQTA
jgi:[ribosomal protein S18]-alanine N-acetyltransferase